MIHTEPFDGNTLRKISAQVAKGNAQNDVWKDYECISLQIRVGKTSATWSFKTRDNQIKIADLAMFGKEDLPALRELVRQGKALEKDGRPVEPLLREFVVSRSLREAKGLADVADGKGMTWERARDLFLEWLKENRSRDTYRGYRSALGAADKSVYVECFAPISGRPVGAITTSDLAIVRNRINTRGKLGHAKGRSVRQADLAVAAMKAAWVHFVNEPETFGIDITNAATDLRKIRDRAARSESSSGKAERIMSQLELGMFLDELGNVTNEISRYVLTLQLLTGQRRLDVCSAIAESFVVRESGGMVWRLEDKCHAWRVLPLPDFARDVADEAKRKFSKKTSRYLFPMHRKRRKSDPDRDGHVSERTVSSMMESMRKDGGPFAESSIKPSTHDLRKALVTYMSPRLHRYSVEGRQLTRDDIEMITHTDEGRETTATLVYDKSEYLDVKLAILTEWQEYILEGLNMWLAQKDVRKAA